MFKWTGVTGQSSYTCPVNLCILSFSKTAMLVVLFKIDFSHLDSCELKQTFNSPVLRKCHLWGIVLCVLSFLSGCLRYRSDCYLFFDSLLVQTFFWIMLWEHYPVGKNFTLVPKGVSDFILEKHMTNKTREKTFALLHQSVKSERSQVFSLFMLILLKHQGHKCFHQLFSLAVWTVNVSWEVTVFWNFCWSLWTPQDTSALFCISRVVFPSSVSLSKWPVKLHFYLIYNLFVSWLCLESAY